MKRLRDIGEDALIDRLVAGFPQEGMIAGPGDDCAVIDPGRGRLRLLKTDAIVAGVHFEPDTPASKVGWKAVARVVSDFAAMGGRPEHLMVTVALPADTPVRWAEALYRGVKRCLDRCGGVLAGGETTRVPDGSAAVISVSGEGSVARGAVVLRSGGKPGDLLAVTGRLGGSIGGRHLTFQPRLSEAEWLAAHGATAMMDLSDGLAKDLPRLARASGCGAVVEREALPRHRGCTIEQAMTDGEDYELLVALEPGKWKADTWPADFNPLTVIGRLAEEGETFAGGWDHFGR
ncbi:thiamine-phosphate kinase [Haloferula sp. A504]|uniref:thiamine-phosphate kinase n=1 Tax=Haloferula sp. A504 TaxID=3373601 RepID=UPI0031BBF6B3|nr:thiamine-phosphate kinase [Verrucomicrobiaceae bacterium E54]